MDSADTASLNGVMTITKTEAAYRSLRLAMENGDLRPGTKLRIGALKDRLGVSPTPIREALRLLQADGLVEHTPYFGTVVKTYSPETVGEIYRLRAVVEPLATEWAAARLTDKDLNELRKLHQLLEAELRKGAGGTDAASLNTAWHLVIYRASGSPFLLEFIERLWSGVGGGKAAWTSRRAEISQREHQGIMDALNRRDSTRAAELVRQHIEEGGTFHSARLRQLQVVVSASE